MIVHSTCGEMNEAMKIGRDLLEGRLSVCVNVVQARSCHGWKGKVRLEKDCLVIIKSRSEILE